MIKVTIKFSYDNNYKNRECPHYHFIKISGHAYEGQSVDVPTTLSGVIPSKVCASFSTLLSALKIIIDLFDGVETNLQSGLFVYKCGFSYFLAPLDYRLDTLIWFVDYISQQYPSLCKIDMEEIKV